MAHKVLTLDGAAAAKKLVAKGKIVPRMCLEEVDKAFGSPLSDRHYGTYANAALALKRARELGALRTGPISEAPEGSILYYTYGTLGHIAIKGAGGKVATIDFPTKGRAALADPAAMAKAWGSVKYVGYAYGPGAYLGNTVTVAGAAVVAPPAPGLAPNQTSIQVALAARGYSVVIDGEYGAQSQAAARSFQRSVGIKQDAEIGPVTWAKLRIVEDSKLGPQTIRGVQALLGAVVDGHAGAQTDAATQKAWGFKLSNATPAQILRAQRACNAGAK